MTRVSTRSSTLAPKKRSRALPVLQSLDAIESSPAPSRPGPISLSDVVGDPFSSHKILNHFERLKGIIKGELVYPITVEIDPTNNCNHRCKWCVSIEAHTGELLELERFTSLIGELRASDVRSIVLKGGGEPTTHPRINDMLDALREAKMPAGLITNGSIPRAGTIERIRQTCTWVRISLDAATAETHQQIHGTKDFRRIIGNVEALVAGGADGGESAGERGGPMIGLNFVTEPRNYREMADFARMGKSLGVAYVTIRCVFDPGNPLPADVRDAMRAGAIEAKRMEEGNFRVFLGNFTERYLTADAAAPFAHPLCLGPNLVGIVGGDGEVYACCYLRGNRRFSFGNIARDSFADIWSGPRRQAVMRAVYRGECGRVCAGGMTANRYNNYNDILNYLAAEEKMHEEFA